MLDIKTDKKSVGVAPMVNLRNPLRTGKEDKRETGSGSGGGRGGHGPPGLSGYHADTPITIKAEPFIWPTAAFINIHEHPL